nr:glycosyltransferase family 2 protein [Ameyamaea chiangmaiensis]
MVSIVVPFHDEASGIDMFFAAVRPVMDARADVSWEVVCVDDGSRDDTLVRLIAQTRSDARVRVLELSRNFGKEAALTAGIDAARGQAVIPMDGDLQDPPSLLSPMLDAWRGGAEVVLARRSDRSRDSVARRHTAAWFYRLHNRLSKTQIPENVGDFRLMDRVVVDALRRLPERQRFMKGLFAWVGFRTVTLDYARPLRAVGRSRFSGVALWNFALEGFTGFSTAPLRIWTYVGAVFAALSLLYGGFILVHTILSGSRVPGYASLFVAVTFFGSVQLISIGLLGEYIGRIYMETKQRPIYLVRSTYTAQTPHASDPVLSR